MKQTSVTQATRRMDLQAAPDQVMRAVESLRTFCAEQEVPERLVCGLTLALEEAASNIVNHACKKDSQQSFTVVFEHLGDRLVVTTRDRGPAFDPLTAPPPRVGFDSDDLAMGGIGIYLARQFVDDLTYAREADENVLRMIKILSSAQPPK